MRSAVVGKDCRSWTRVEEVVWGRRGASQGEEGVCLKSLVSEEPLKTAQAGPVLRELSGQEAQGTAWMTSALADKGSRSLYCHGGLGRLSV